MSVLGSHFVMGLDDVDVKPEAEADGVKLRVGVDGGIELEMFRQVDICTEYRRFCSCRRGKMR